MLKTETYTEIKKRHSDEFGAFPICFAFSNEQLEKALAKLGADIKDCATVGAGSIIKKSDIPALEELRGRHESEMTAFMQDDNSLIDAIIYELGNHEFGYTMDPSETIDALGLDMADKRIADCFQSAKTKYWELNQDNF